MADKAEAKATGEEEEILKTGQSPEASVTFLDKMNDKEESKVAGEEEKRLKRKQSLEASVTLGLGCGKKKKVSAHERVAYHYDILKGSLTLCRVTTPAPARSDTSRHFTALYGQR